MKCFWCSSSPSCYTILSVETNHICTCVLVKMWVATYVRTYICMLLTRLEMSLLIDTHVRTYMMDPL